MLYNQVVKRCFDITEHPDLGVHSMVLAVVEIGRAACRERVEFRRVLFRSAANCCRACWSNTVSTESGLLTTLVGGVSKRVYPLYPHFMSTRVCCTTRL